jgi:glycyl-radical enzyme activating protein
MSQYSGHIFDIQRMSIHDGPGIRTVVFLKGCPLSCRWCHNPEGIDNARELFYTSSLCVACGKCVQECDRKILALASNFSLQRDPQRCLRCGRCAEICPTGALKIIGRTVSVEEVMDEVLRDCIFYEESGGGLTISGGEPLQQSDFVLQLLKAAKENRIHTCLETCGFGAAKELLSLAALTDMILFDWKETNPVLHKQWTGVSNTRIKRNLATLNHQEVPVILRCPLIPGLNLREDHLDGIAKTAASLHHCTEIHLMTFHNYGLSKYAALGKPVPKVISDTRLADTNEMEQAKEYVSSLWPGNIEIY